MVPQMSTQFSIFNRCRRVREVVGNGDWLVRELFNNNEVKLGEHQVTVPTYLWERMTGNVPLHATSVAGLHGFQVPGAEEEVRKFCK